ncbi:MAG: AAA family ATPase [Dehalococcoidia bacterium]
MNDRDATNGADANEPVLDDAAASFAGLSAELACGTAGCQCAALLKRGKGSTHCPTHDDKNPSLSVTLEGPRILVRCHAGCDQAAVIDELKRLGLWPRKQAWPARIKGVPVESRYIYTDAEGCEAFAVLRLPEKGFRACRWVGSKLEWSRPPVPLPLYRLPEILAAGPGELIWVVEGEKDADRLNAEGRVATTNPFGAGKWNMVDQEPLRGRDVVIVADNDGPGREHAAGVAAALATVARSVRVVTAIPGAAEHGDVSDYLDAGGSLDDLLAAAEAVAPGAPGTAPVPRRAEAGLDLVSLDQVVPEVVEWLWRPYVPRGKLTLLVGDPETGKTWTALFLAAAVTAGELFDDEFEPRDVLVATSEDGLADTIRQRLDTLGADLSRVHAITGFTGPDGSQKPFSLAEHVTYLERAIDEHDIGLLVIDPLSSFMGPGTDSNKDAQVRQVLEALVAVAGRHGTAVLGVVHLTKDTNRSRLMRTQGSVAFVALARSVLGTSQSKQEAAEFVLTQIKSNLGSKGPSLRFRPGSKGVEWLGEASNPQGEEAVSSKRLAEARDFLASELADGPRLVDALHQGAKDLGISSSTLKRAKRELGVESHKRKNHWEWELPAPAGSLPVAPTGEDSPPDDDDDDDGRTEQEQ